MVVNLHIIAGTTLAVLTLAACSTETSTTTADRRGGDAAVRNDSSAQLPIDANATAATPVVVTTTIKADGGNVSQGTIAAAATPKPTPTPTAVPTPILQTMEFAVGYGGSIVGSADGTTWTAANVTAGPVADNNFTFRGVCSGDHTVLAVGGGTPIDAAHTWGRKAVSRDGVTWTEIFDNVNWWGGCAYGNNRFVAVGGQGIAIVSLDDGVTWSTIVRVADTNQDLMALRGVVFGNGVFLAYGDQGPAISRDGVLWNANLPQSQNIANIVFGNGLFLGTRGGLAVTSPDGVTWTNGGSVNAQTIIPTDKLFYAYAPYPDASVYTSTDGQIWTATANQMYVGATVYANSRFYTATGWGNPTIYNSTDGTTWTAAATGFFSPINQMASAQLLLPASGGQH